MTPQAEQVLPLGAWSSLACWGCFICTSADAEVFPTLSVLRSSAALCFFISQVEGSLSGWGSRGACGRGQLELKGFPFGCVFHEGMSLLPPPPAPYHGFHPQTQHVTRAVNNSTSFETLPPMFGSLLGKQRCLHSDISWCEVLDRDQVPSGLPLCLPFSCVQTAELEELCVTILWESKLALVNSPQSSMNWILYKLRSSGVEPPFP